MDLLLYCSKTAMKVRQISSHSQRDFLTQEIVLLSVGKLISRTTEAFVFRVASARSVRGKLSSDILLLH